MLSVHMRVQGGEASVCNGTAVDTTSDKEGRVVAVYMTWPKLVGSEVEARTHRINIY